MINIVLLGETGVGKSTFINAFVNYSTFKSIDDAKSNPLCLIPIKFSVTDNDHNYREVVLGHSANEVTTAGSSSTQRIQPYIFPFGARRIRIFDTPGIGDSRGIQQDIKNLNGIFRHLQLSNVQEVNAICILLKPNQSRLTTMFQFCVKELLTNIHNRASPNIFFCFTNSRSTFYRPGETINPLREILRSCQGLELSRDSIFCFDSESFRYLCMLQSGMTFDARTSADYEQSWQQSSAECQRMLATMDTLAPHKLPLSIAIYKRRRKMAALLTKAAELRTQISGVTLLKKQLLKQMEGYADEDGRLRSQLMVSRVCLVEEMSHRRTVCGNPTCSSMMYSYKKKKSTIFYETVCHKDCRELWNVPLNTMGVADFRNCKMMDKYNDCLNCKCPWEQHLQIDVMQTPSVLVVEDDGVLKQIADNRKKYDKSADEFTKAEIKKHQLDQRNKNVMRTLMAHGRFLKHFAVLLNNDSKEQYLQLLLAQENEKVALAKVEEDGATVKRRIDSLRKLQGEFVEEQRLMQELGNFVPKRMTYFSVYYNVAAERIEFREIKTIAKVNHWWQFLGHWKRIRDWTSFL